MTTRDELYRKFGETAEAAQLLEHELGTILLTIRGAEEGLLFGDKPTRAREILAKIDKSTLGQVLKQVGSRINSPQALEALFEGALNERNRLIHSFYREHNFKINTDEGRSIMIKDLETIHEKLLEAFKAALAISGIDLDCTS